ncbi:MAG TPA: thiolase domain-containing protein [Ramlibacter sp.]|nr:thiolase domain-containing protein [Ramlibacter sp.]
MLPCIVGWSHTPFGKLADQTAESLIADAATAALAHAGIAGADVDQVYLGCFNPGLVRQDFMASLAINAVPGLRFKPATRVENACATGSAAIFQAAQAIAAGRARFALVIGVEKMTELDSEGVGQALLKASYVPETEGLPGGFAGVFGRIAETYFARHGDQSEALAMIAAKNHRHAMANPLAHMRRDMGVDFCNTVSERNPLVAGPLRRTDCALITDGAAALVLADAQTALRMHRAVALRGMAQANDVLPLAQREDVTDFAGARIAWQKAQQEAGVTNADLAAIELHDCFTISELLQYEALGLAPRGHGAEAIRSGRTCMGGEMPVNPSGGLKARGHPVGATGVSMHVNMAMQVRGEAGDMQVKDAAVGAVFNMGGVAVANYATVLEALR